MWTLYCIVALYLGQQQPCVLCVLYCIVAVTVCDIVYYVLWMDGGWMEGRSSNCYSFLPHTPPPPPYLPALPTCKHDMYYCIVLYNVLLCVVLCGLCVLCIVFIVLLLCVLPYPTLPYLTLPHPYLPAVTLYYYLYLTFPLVDLIGRCCCLQLLLGLVIALPQPCLPPSLLVVGPSPSSYCL